MSRNYYAAVQFTRNMGGRPYTTPESATLSKVRLQDISPFTITGIDFTGAPYVKQCNPPVSKLYSLELSEDVSTVTQGEGSQEDCTTADSSDISSINDCPHCKVAQRARQQLAEWTKIICAPRRMSEITSDMILTLLHTIAHVII